MRAWLAARDPGMPEALRAAVDRVLEQAEAARAVPGDAPLPDRLAEAALCALGHVVLAEPERALASELLAADALLTYACEAAAEAGGAEIERITMRFDESRIARLLEPEGP